MKKKKQLIAAELVDEVRDLVSLRRALLELELDEDRRIARAATLWLAALGGFIKLVSGKLGEVEMESMAMKVGELFTVGLDHALAALGDDLRPAPEIPHLGLARNKMEGAREVAAKIAQLRNELRRHSPA